jgi:hypothetical protein
MLAYQAPEVTSLDVYPTTSCYRSVLCTIITLAYRPYSF